MLWQIFSKHILRFGRGFGRNVKPNALLCYTVQLPNILILKQYVSNSQTRSSSAPSPSVTNIEKKFINQETVLNVPGAEAKSEEKDNTVRNMKYTLLFLGLSFTAVGSYILIKYGAPAKDEMGKPTIDEFSDLPIWKQYFLRGIRQVQQFAEFLQEPSREKLLPDPLAYPYYQPPYTLVLEFTDVLAHPEWSYQTGWRFKKRPGVDYFLENLAGLYEIVVFTAEPGITIFPLIEALDNKGLISYKLVRDSTHFIDGHHVKNLDRLNRDLKKVIIIDWDAKSVKFHKDNHFVINRWKGNDEDSTLVELTAFLRTIAETDIEDVRDVLKFYKEFDDPLNVFKQKQIEYFEKQKHKQEKPIPQHPKESVMRLFNYFL